MQTIRTCLLTSAALIAMALPSQGADQRWNGFYIGGNFGYGNGRATADFSLLGIPAISGSETMKGWVGGAQAGYNRQFGWLVAGLEIDAQATGQKATSTQLCISLACGLLPITQSSNDRLEWFGSLRPRLGITVGPLMIYGTGGVAYGQFKNTQTLTTLLGSVTNTSIDQHLAVVYGGGAEALLGRSWSVKIEYLYLDSGTVTTNYSLLGVGLIAEKARLTDSMLRAGVNYHF